MKSNLLKHLFPLLLILLLPFLFTGCASDESDDDTSTTSVYTGHASWGIKTRTDSTGDIYITGIAYGDITSDSDEGEADVFLTKYNSSGTRLWLKQLGTDEEDYVQDIKISSSGSIYLAGYTDGVMETDASYDGSDIFVMKFNSSGTRQWVRQIGTDSDDHCWGLAVDASDNIYLAGDTGGVFTGVDVSNNQGVDMVLIKLDATGTLQWVKQLGTDQRINTNTYSDSYGIAVSLDSSGDIVFGGNTNDAIGGDKIGDNDIVLAKYDSSGNQIWINQIGTEYGDYVEEIAISDSGNIYFTGYSYGTVDTSYDYSNYSESHTYTELFVFKYNSSGQQQWVTQYGSAYFDRGNALVLDSSENVYLAGNTSGDLVADNEGSYDYFLMQIDSSGSIVWQVQNGSDSYDTVNGISLDGSNDLYITGRTYGELDSLSNDDASFAAFVSKFGNTGTRLWTKLF